MKTIASKILLFTLGLLLFVLGSVSFWTFKLLKSENRAYTYQSQLLQTRLVGKPFGDQFNRIQEILDKMLVHSNSQMTAQVSDADRQDFEKLGIIGIQKLVRQNNEWSVAPGEASLGLEPVLKMLPEKGLALEPLSFTSHQLGLARLGTSIGFLASFSVDSILKDCAGLPVFLMNSELRPMFSCDESLSKELASPSSSAKFGSAFSKIKESKFGAGSFETTEQSNDLWSYYQANELFRAIGMVPSMVAFRPAYFMALRLGLLLLASLGVAIVISVMIARRLAQPIVIVTEATGRIAAGDFDVPIDVQSKDETRLLADSVRAMAQKIKHLIVSEIEKSKLESQLEVAGTVQKTLIPKTSLTFPGLCVESYYHPADQCGGDWWGFVTSPGKMIFIVGDVTGHGYPSALLVATTRGYISMVQNHVDRFQKLEWSAGELLAILNQVVFDATQGELNMTAMCVVMDTNTGEFEMASAAHNSAFLLRPESGEVKTLLSKGQRLGESATLIEPYKITKGKLAVGEQMILYTDGLMDLGSEEKTLGKKGLQQFLTKHVKEKPAKIVEEIKNELIPLNEGRSLVDDITFVAIERLSEGQNS